MNNIFNNILNCKSCKLCNNQSPLVQQCFYADVFWVGLSAVQTVYKSEIPLSPTTNSGKLINSIESFFQSNSFYKTNAVKCLPLDNKKIRYPSISEMKSCFFHLKEEIQFFKPQLVFLLGKQVSSFVLKEFSISAILFDDEFKYSSFFIENILYVPIHHPSYILVYKRKKLRNYISSIENILANIQINNKTIKQSALRNELSGISNLYNTPQI